MCLMRHNNSTSQSASNGQQKSGVKEYKCLYYTTDILAFSKEYWKHSDKKKTYADG